MKRPDFRYALMAIVVVLFTPIAIAERVGPTTNSDSHATPATRSLEPVTHESLAKEVQSEPEATMPVDASANVLNGEPRNFPSERSRTSCRSDPLTGEIPVQCRRFSEIASPSL